MDQQNKMKSIEIHDRLAKDYATISQFPFSDENLQRAEQLLERQKQLLERAKPTQPQTEHPYHSQTA